MRRVWYSVAMSLDGFIAGPAGEVDWLPMDLDLDWDAFMARFDTVVMGRTTYEFSLKHGGGGGPMRTYVCSTTLDPEAHPQITVTADARGTVTALRSEVGKDVWLMGGGGLFGDLLNAGLVDVVEVALVPILLGKGIPFVERLPTRIALGAPEVGEVGRGVLMLTYHPRGPA